MRPWWWRVAVRVVTVAIAVTAARGALALLQISYRSEVETWVGHRLLATAGIAALLLVAAWGAQGLTGRSWVGVAGLALVVGVLGAGVGDVWRRQRSAGRPASALLAGYDAPADSVEQRVGVSDGPRPTRMWLRAAPYSATCGEALAAFRAWADAGSVATGPACDARARHGDLDVTLSVRAETGGIRIVLSGRPSGAD